MLALRGDHWVVRDRITVCFSSRSGYRPSRGTGVAIRPHRLALISFKSKAIQSKLGD